MSKKALIVGAGDGISASFARQLQAQGWQIALSARNTDKLEEQASALSAKTFSCDVSKKDDVSRLFQSADSEIGDLDLVHFNPSYRIQGPFVELDPDGVERTLAVSSFGGFLVAQEAAKRMVKRGHGAIFFTGASASVKGYAKSAPFAMGKFALRGLAQSMARELAPQNIHVAHFVIDGGVRSERRGIIEQEGGEADRFLDPDAIAESMMAILSQKRSAWSWEIELRPWVERF